MLHGATNDGTYYQFYSKTNLITPASGGWALGEVRLCPDGTNDIWFDPLSCTNPPSNFFRAVGAGNEARLEPDRYWYHAIEPSGRLATDGVNAQFHVVLQQTTASDLTVFYAMSGTASNSTDFTITGVPLGATVGSAVVPAGHSSTPVVVQPVYSLPDFDEFAVFTLIPTNGYTVDPTNAVVSITISDNLGTNIFDVVATNYPSWGWAVDLDYTPVYGSLVLSVNYADQLYSPATVPGFPCNFALLGTSGTILPWSVVTNVGQYWMELHLATAKIATNGYAVGDVFFGNWTNGDSVSQAFVGRVSADGSAAAPLWLALPNETDQLSGGLYLDQTGIWGYDLLVTTGQEGDFTGTTRGVWRVNPAAQTATQITRIPAAHLEGALTVPNDARYGPWAGKLLTGDEYQKVIYAIAPGGGWTPYWLDISPDTFRLIPADQDLYCCAIAAYQPNVVLKLSRDLLAPYAGDVLIIQSGEVGGVPPTVCVAHWNGLSFDVTRIPLAGSFPGYAFEHAVFAPISIPALSY